MRFLDRGRVDAPDLRSFSEIRQSQMVIDQFVGLSEKARSQHDLPVEWKHQPPSILLPALIELSGGKCAFCEQQRDDLIAYRFRPPADAKPAQSRTERICYIWLIWDWENFYPICPDCMPEIGEKSFFPVRGERLVSYQDKADEQRLLLDPCSDKTFWKHFSISEPGVLEPRSECGKVTLAHFRLNRSQLVERRRDVFAKRLSLLESWVEEYDHSPLLIERTYAPVFRFDALEFGGSWYLFLRDLAVRLKQRYGGRDALTPGRLGKTFLKWRADRPLLIDLRSELAFSMDEIPLPEDTDIIDELIAGDFSRFGDRGGASPDVASAASDAADPSDEAPPGLTDDERRMVRCSHSPLKTVSIKSFKSLSDIAFNLPDPGPPVGDAAPGTTEIADAQMPALLILGENATGKSSILEAIAIACAGKEALDALELDSTRYTLQPKYMGSRNGVAPDRADIEVQFCGSGSSWSDGKTIRVTVHADARRIVREVLPPQDANESPLKSGEPPLLFAYGSHRLFEDRAQGSGPASHIATLFSASARIGNPEPWLVDLAERDGETLDEVVAALRHIITIDGEFSHLEVHPDERDGQPRCHIHLIKRRNGKVFPVEAQLGVVSSGYKVLLGLVCDVFRGIIDATGRRGSAIRDVPVLVLIDEVETHLHPRWKIQIMRSLRRALPKATFVATSHDPLCVRGMGAGEVMVLNRYVNESSVGWPEMVEKMTDFPNVETHTVEQLLTSDMFQLASTDDAGIERHLSALSRRSGDLGAARDNPGLRDVVLGDIAQVLPFGTSDVHRLVYEAMCEYLAARRISSSEETKRLRDKAKAQVISILRDIAG